MSDVIIQRYINLKGTDKDVFLIRDGKKIPYSEVDENGDIIYKYNKDVTFEPCLELNKEEVIKTRV